jgi:thiol-disulfide isomerase/thioredoxin
MAKKSTLIFFMFLVRKNIAILFFFSFSLFAPFFAWAESDNFNLAQTLNSKTIDDKKTLNYINYQNRPVVLVYWAWWCSVCKQQLHNLNALQQKNIAQKFYIIGISVDDTQKNHKKTLKIAKNLHFDNIYLDHKNSVDYPESIPLTLFFNSKHEQIAKIEGETDEKELEKIVFSLL